MKKILILSLLTLATLHLSAHNSDSTHRFTISSIAEAAFSHRLSDESAFYLPGVALALTYEFGKGWTVSGEIELAQPNPLDGEKADMNVTLSEFFIEKSFSPLISLKAGYFLQPLGHTGVRDTPLGFFTTSPPTNECALIPFNLKDIGLGIHGEAGRFSYAAMLASALNAFTLRGEYTLASGINLALSAHSRPFEDSTVYASKTRFNLAALDLHLERRAWLLRSNLLYRHANPKAQKSEHALGFGIEAGYDLLTFSAHRNGKGCKLYPFLRYDYIHTLPDRPTSFLACGINFMPCSCLVVKGQYSALLPHSSAPHTSELGVSIAFVY